MNRNFIQLFVLLVFPITAAGIFFLPNYGKVASIVIFFLVNGAFLIGLAVDTSSDKKKRSREPTAGGKK
jgi:hypothetical protein